MTNTKKRLLIVDDEEAITEDLKDFFQEEGFEVTVASDGEKAIQLIKSTGADICLLDMKLPDMSGLLVLKIAKEERPAMKVIVNTGYVDQNLIDQANELKCDVFMHKPFNLIELRDTVAKLSS